MAANARVGEELLCSIVLPVIMTNSKDGNSENESGQPSWVNTPKLRTFRQLVDAGVKVRELVSEVKRRKSIPSRRVGECIISRSKQCESESSSPSYASH